MLTKEVISELYRKYKKLPSSPDELDIASLFEHLHKSHDVSIDDEGNLVIHGVDENSPFHAIPLRNIHAIVNFEEEVAIVLHSTIIILDKKDSNVYVNLRAVGTTFAEKLRSLFMK